MRLKISQVFGRISERLGTEEDMSAEVVPAEDVRRLPERGH
ncbi:hypothetical protein AB0B78_31115 [Streptomyces sp. NPDC040724]